MSHYKPYPEYKDSGVEWIGEVPAHWGDTKLVRVFKEKGKDLTAQYPAGAISFGEVVTKEMRNEETLASYQALEEGEFIVNPLNLNYDLKSLRVALSDKDVRVSSGYIILRLCDGFQPRYVRWLMYLFDIRYMKTLGGGIRQTITFADIAKCHVAIPGCAEQSQIATFLDRETTRIDTLIEKKKRFIELLEEKRQAVITHAVTKGLDPDVPMKDSGVEWIGEVPAHWASKRVGHFVISKGGGTPQRDYAEFWDGDIPWVTPKDMKTRMISTTQDSITEAGLHSSSAQWIPPWHVLLVMRSGILRHTLPSALNNCPVTVNQDIRALDVSRGFSPQYFQMFIDGMNRQLLYAWSKQGVTVESLESDLIDQTFLPTPPRDEQLQIVAFLNRETSRIDTLIAKTRQSIELLKERRSALITAAVTGKIDVREEAA